MEENYISNWTKIEWDRQKGDVRISLTFLYDDGFPLEEFAFFKDQLRISSTNVQSLLNNNQPPLDESEPTENGSQPLVTQSDITEILQEKDISFTVKNDSTLEFDAKGENATFLVQIHLNAKQNFLYITIPYIITVPPDSPQAEIIMPAMMDLNYRCGLIKFEWFRKAGEIRSSYVFHTKNTFSKSSFMTALIELIKTTDLAYPTLTKLEKSQG